MINYSNKSKLILKVGIGVFKNKSEVMKKNVFGHIFFYVDDIVGLDPVDFLLLFDGPEQGRAVQNIVEEEFELIVIQ